jgi:hypothetical protein
MHRHLTAAMAASVVDALPMGADMCRIGIDVSSQFKPREEALGAKLAGPITRNWEKWASNASNIAASGLCFGTIKSDAEDQTYRSWLVQVLKKHEQDSTWLPYAAHAANVTDIGLNVCEQVERVSPALHSTLDGLVQETEFDPTAWAGVAYLGAHMQRAGLKVDLKRHRPKMLAELNRRADEGDWPSFAEMAAGMAELGLLSRRTDREGPSLPAVMGAQTEQK